MSCQDEDGSAREGEAVHVDTSQFQGVKIEVEFGVDEIRSVFAVRRQGEKTTSLIREAVLALVRQRESDTAGAVLPEAGS